MISSIPPAIVRVLPFNDDRKDLEGEVTAAFGVPMGHIRFEQSPATLLGQVVISELKAAGHRVADSAEGTQIKGTVREFEAHTDTTPLYWDVIGNLAVSLQVSVARGPIQERHLTTTHDVRAGRTYGPAKRSLLG